MKINFLGDSITQGAGAERPENMYTTLVADYFKAEECNYGIGGTRIAKQIKPTNNPDDDVFMCRAVKLPRDADFTFVFGGTNDYGHGDAKLGTFNDRDDYTFYGAFHNLVAYMVGAFAKDKLCFILPIPRFDQDNPYGDGSKDEPIAPMSAYIEAEKEVLAYYGVEYLDLSGLFYIPENVGYGELFCDGLHPNPKGHRVLADCLIEYLKQRGLPCMR